MEASDYRGAINNELTEKSPSMQNQQNPPSYANATKANPVFSFPKKDQAIIMNSVDNLKLTDYVVSIGELIQPRNVLFASRMSNRRICIYLSSVQLVDEIVNNHRVLTIQDNCIEIRRLITPARRIIISNVSPCIPHEYIEKTLRNLNLKPVSPITFLRAGITGEQYSHVLSFRRQVYIHDEGNIDLPSSIVIKHEEVSYRIFMNFDDMSCFLCKEVGHVAKNCTNHTQQAAVDSNSSHQIPIQSTSHVDQASDTEMQPVETLHVSKKRPATTIESISTENISTSTQDLIVLTLPDQEIFTPPLAPIRNIKNTKRMKRSDSDESEIPIEELMAPVKKLFEGTENVYPLTYDQVKDFFSNVYKNPDPLSVAKTYTENIPEFLKLLTDLHPNFTHRSIKNRCTRIKKKILMQLQEEIVISDSDSSQSSFNENTTS